MPYPFIWYLVYLDVAIMYNLSVVVLAVYLHIQHILLLLCFMILLSFIIFRSTLDDKYQVNFASRFKYIFVFFSIGEFIVNVQCACVSVGVCTCFSINFRFNCILLCVCVGVGVSLSVFEVTNGYSIENFLNNWWRFIIIIPIFWNCVICMGKVAMRKWDGTHERTDDLPD